MRRLSVLANAIALLGLVFGGCARKTGEPTGTQPNNQVVPGGMAPAGRPGKQGTGAAGEIPPPILVDLRRIRETYADGSPKEQYAVKFFSDDSTVKDGSYTQWYPNGNKFQEGAYVDGKQDGLWTFWSPDGKVAKTVNYKAGKPDGLTTIFRSDGTTKEREEIYRDGKRQGRWVQYNERGVHILQEEYKDGVLSGTQIAWYDNGKEKFRVELRDGKRHGKATFWDEQGQMTSERLYENGQPVNPQQPAGAPDR